MARELGVDRRTVRRWIHAGELDRELDSEAVRYKPRPPVDRKIDAYRGIVQSRLEEFPRLSAVRLFDEVRAAGYSGSYTQLGEYVRSVRPRPPVEPVVRFETPPGHQAQVDFAHFRLPWGVRWALLVVLGYSRLLWLSFYERQDMRVLFSGLESAFDFFGGVPREILFDQMRSVVVPDDRFEEGRLIEHAEMLRFAHHWAFGLEPVGRAGPRPRARWSVRFATSAKTSSTVATSSPMRISRRRSKTGFATSPMYDTTARSESDPQSTSSATSSPRCCRWRPGPIGA